ncbi:Histidine kinase-, DNA gyrase B-, and HSP90-like ATPase [Noviherbaspirillum humi]|uniref:histidine kinase n=1 Tax=Noviherbaspirillum humi TaxID=1688639 RepID=A0A239KFS5_9BURK|nr:histidine kinase [Noviherbaspirillum humi]SNT16562.1 Histidine kinase-, DNA gyrase B-, and HSP90-like ATPase [Noviherbaspirillum humi]
MTTTSSFSLRAVFDANLPELARQLPRNLLVGLAIDFVCALVVTYVLRASSFVVSLVFSMCIGLLAQLLIDGGRLLFWGCKRPAGVPFMLLLAAAGPVAYFGGTSLGYLLLNPYYSDLRLSLASHRTSLLVLTLLACFIGSWLFWSRSRMAELAARAEATEKRALLAQLQLLQAQIEPHMLFNTLANLQALIDIDTARAQQMLDQLIVYLRATLASSRADTVTLAEEFRLLEAYLSLMAVRMGTRLAYSLDLPAELAARRIPPMLLQPLVENAIRHGLEPKVGAGRVDISAAVDGPNLRLTVADTGLGLQAAGATRGSGIGLDNVRERLRALAGGGAGLTLQPNAPEGTRATITLPL